jgi:hypothetical protein
MWIWKGTVKMRKMKRRKMRRRRMWWWMRMRIRMRIRIMAKNLGQLARGRWYIYRLAMLIPW